MVFITIVVQKNGETLQFAQPFEKANFIKFILAACSTLGKISIPGVLLGLFQIKQHNTIFFQCLLDIILLKH